MQQEIISFPCLKQFHSKKQLSKMALWDSTLGISQWPPDHICTVYRLIAFWGFFANCQTCKQKPGSESQAVLFLAYALPVAIKKKTKPKPKQNWKLNLVLSSTFATAGTQSTLFDYCCAVLLFSTKPY